MRHFISLLSSTAGAAAVILFSLSAAAHIELIEPAPRYTLPSNKSCPCGDGDSNRRCQQTAEESTDPNRSENVTTFEAGSTITVVADEYIDHAGRMRVAFDPDGADLADFNQNILVDEPDFSESGLSSANPHVWEFQVKLPTEPCDNCTLQVIQVMNGDTANAVLDPAPVSTYYSCADIRIVPAGTAANDDDEAAASGVAGATAQGSGAQSSAGSGGTASAAGNGANAAAGSGPAVSQTSDADSDDGNCALQPGRVSASSAWEIVALGGVFTALGLRRRRR
jgi:Lytic polysaccharide mono-oxygenase, cellulose-degrading